ncbi:MAG: sugar ABC transporter permease [Anaerolineales bacterium]|nr:sugar ABC transporter permease [Anaerolineales bacterium]
MLFVFPTLLGVLVFNVYPIILNTYVSFTNRNKFHPYPDCAVGLSGVLDPVCWPVFRDKVPTGLGQPYVIETPFYANYADLIGKLFTGPALLALLALALLVVPFAAVSVLTTRFPKEGSPPVSTSVLWLGAALVALLFAFLFNARAAWDTLMTSGDFIVVVMRTLLFVLLRVPASFLLGLTLALILNSTRLPGRTFFRVVLFIPWAASSLAILMALVWQFFFREQGTLNQVLAVIGVKGLSWLQNPTTAFAAIVIADLWFSYPFFMIAILGALQSIPMDAYEAAEVDGANYWQQLTRITLPLIRPAILPATVLTSITAFQMFGTAWAMTTGGPVKGAGQPGATEFVMVYAFKQIFQTQNYGRATAFAVILFIFLFAATLYSLRLTRITKGAME